MIEGINPISTKKIELRILATMESCFGFVRPCQRGNNFISERGIESVTVLLARRPVRQTGFLPYKQLYNIAVYLWCYLDGMRCSWVIINNYWTRLNKTS